MGSAARRYAKAAHLCPLVCTQRAVRCTALRWEALRGWPESAELSMVAIVSLSVGKQGTVLLTHVTPVFHSHRSRCGLPTVPLYLAAHSLHSCRRSTAKVAARGAYGRNVKATVGAAAAVGCVVTHGHRQRPIRPQRIHPRAVSSWVPMELTRSMEGWRAAAQHVL